MPSEVWRSPWRRENAIPPSWTPAVSPVNFLTLTPIPDRIEIVKDIPVVTEGVLEDGVLVLPRLGIKMDAAIAIRADRDEQAERALRR